MPKNDGEQHHDRPDTALGEVLREFERAETDADDSREKRHRGEAAEAITPNTGAEEEVREESEGR
ncbi:hypothetical protein [Streptomyces sp. NPDC018610]|jgi:hypothetical protein|uniref:hypothetical protein n=1 Tax=Streptomyces sp. NPDC018610 TaxID=3365049 RepID=UPI0037A0DABF